MTVAEALVSDPDTRLRGVFNMTGRGEASWADFAEAVFAASAEFGGPTAKVRRIATAHYPTDARRPANSRLDSSKLERVHGVRLPDWRQSVKQVVKRLLERDA
jgi:dTDP-4-dehydrorhamnose reductase